MAETDTVMTDAPVEASEAPASPQVVDSIEVEPDVKAEDGQAGSEQGDGDTQEDLGGSDGRPVSNAQYRALKAIADTLTDFKIQKGNE
jgi:hypothetical protein